MDNQFNFEGSPMPPMPEKKKKDGFAIASLVLGIVALVLACPCCCCLYPVAGVCAILAIVFSILSLKKSGKNGLAIAGLVLGIVALIIIIAIIISVIATPDTGDIDLSTDQKVIDWMYKWLEKSAGKEFADQWYEEMMKAMQGEGSMPPELETIE